MHDVQPEPIAIVGIGCRFPGAEHPQAFWTMLREGRHGIREVPADRWELDALYDPEPTRPGRMITRWGGFLDQVDGFDWRAFRIPPREAKFMDPQHRLLLEVAWEALEDAGLPLEEVAGTRTGVFVGISWNDYLRLQARDWSRLDGYTAAGNPFAFAANRISFAFDLRGPSLALDATCASSLASVHYACQSLWTGAATLALAGGVNLMLSPDATIIMSKAGILSPEGRCKALDARADGFVRGEGAGLVVLKRRSQLRPSDRVYAFIRAVTMGHNGRNEWIMAPSGRAQQQVLGDAYREAGIDPAAIDYVELHGTGFPKGDPVEARALSAALDGPGRVRPCAIGSVKTNIGNLEAASGVASLIKVALALHHREIPPTLNLETVNPDIPLEALGLAAQRDLTPWPGTGAPSLAGVTVTSFSGVNAHVVLEGAPSPETTRVFTDLSRGGMAADGRPAPTALELVLPLSARSPEALRARARQMGEELRTAPVESDGALWDLCFTAAVHRTHLEYRLAVVGASRQALCVALEQFLGGEAGPDLFVGEKPISRPIGGGDTLEDPSARDQGAGAARIVISARDAAHRYITGQALRWRTLYPEGRCVPLPPYPWQRERLWLEWLTPHAVSTPPESAAAAPSAPPASQPPSGRDEEQRAAPSTDLPDRLQAASPRQRRELLSTHIHRHLLEILGLEPDRVLRPQQRLFEAGLNSLGAVALKNRLQAELSRPLPSTLLFDYPTIDGLAGYLLSLLQEPPLAVPCAPGGAPPSGSTGASAASVTPVLEVDALSEEEAEALMMARLTELEERL